jgi:mRNA-degrading endonuclease RelE of RelBE toxin-antitoxin system
MTASDDEWDWRFTDPAEREYEKFQPHEQERIVSKLDEIVTDQWRDPSDYLEPLTGPPHSKLRIGAFRLGCEADQTDHLRGCPISKSGRGPPSPATTNRLAEN